MDRQPDLAPGVRLGSYVLEASLGEGGMARVYLARHHILGTPAAVKVIERRGDHGPDHAERFRREARSLFKLKHSNIVQFLEFGVAEDVYYLTVEYVDGADLGWVLRQYRRRNERMPLQDGIAIIGQVSEALDYVHRQGIVHRDVKPSNILLDGQGRALLTDFGLALSATDSTLGAIFGSAQYVSPEQALSSQNSVPQSDVYSLGVVAYELLVGRVPFENDTPLAVALQHMNDAVPSPRALDPDLEPRLETALLRALAKQPSDRYASASDFAQALADAGPPAPADGDRPTIAQETAMVGAAGASPPPADDRRRGRPVRAVLEERPPPTPERPRPPGDFGQLKRPRLTTLLAAASLLGVLAAGIALSSGPGSLGERIQNELAGLPASLQPSAGDRGDASADAAAEPTDERGQQSPTAIPSPRDPSAPVMNLVSCHGYRFVSRIEPGMYAFAVWRTPVYGQPRYEHDPEAGVFVELLGELAPGDRVFVLDHESYPNCFIEARFWKVRADSGIVGWAPEWRFYYYLEP